MHSRCQPDTKASGEKEASYKKQYEAKDHEPLGLGRPLLLTNPTSKPTIPPIINPVIMGDPSTANAEAPSIAPMTATPMVAIKSAEGSLTNFLFWVMVNSFLVVF